MPAPLQCVPTGSLQINRKSISQYDDHSSAKSRLNCVFSFLRILSLRPDRYNRYVRSARLLTAQSVDVLVCQTNGLWQAHAPTARQHDTHGIGKTDSVANGHKDRPGAVAGSQHPADDLSLVNKLARGATPNRRLPMRTQEPALGAADCRHLKPDSQMARQTKTSRMCQAVAINEHYVWPGAELGDGLQDSRRFPEREKSGNVGKAGAGRGTSFLDDFPCLGVPDNNASEKLWPESGTGDIDTSDPARSVLTGTLTLNALGELSLECDRFFGTQIPSMQLRDSHVDTVSAGIISKLSFSQIWAFSQDDDGHLWGGTIKGPAFFDNQATSRSRAL